MIKEMLVKTGSLALRATVASLKWVGAFALTTAIFNQLDDRLNLDDKRSINQPLNNIAKKIGGLPLIGKFVPYILPKNTNYAVPLTAAISAGLAGVIINYMIAPGADTIKHVAALALNKASNFRGK